MPIVIEPYVPQHERGVADFNRRLQAAGAEPDLVFYGNSIPSWLPPDHNKSLYNQFFVVRDGEIIRGGYALKYQDFVFPDGVTRKIGYYHHPLSEGIVNKSHALVGTLLLRDAMNRSPLLYCLGMGGYENPLPQMLIRLGWSHCAVPFYFRVIRPARFLRHMQAVRTSPLRKLLMDLGAYSGAGWLALKSFNTLSALRRGNYKSYDKEAINNFSNWSEELWHRCKLHYSMTAVRDCATLQTLYPSDELTRVRVRHKGNDIGWAVIGERRKDAKYGSLRVGSIIDCFGCPDDALAVVLAASRQLAENGVDLILSNQSHDAWRQAFTSAGFLNASSNFIFAASKPLAALMQPFDQVRKRMHFTRADGDGLPRNF